MLVSNRPLLAWFLSTLLLVTSASAAPVPSINEIMAINYTTTADPQSQFDDWIELYNPESVAVDVGGMYLTDDVDNPTAWQIPTGTSLPARGYLVIWADSDTSDTGLHAGFELDGAGDTVALFDADGFTLIDMVEFDQQTPDVSYGRGSDSSENWVTLSPTPGAANDEKALHVVADLDFSHHRGFYDQLIEVTIETETEGATVRYTLNGSTPTPEYGTVYDKPITISQTSALRALAYKTGWKSTAVNTHTYLFVDDIVQQATNTATGNQITPAGCPTSWGSVTGDYQMDPDVVGQNGTDNYSGLYADTIKNDLKAVPSFCLVMDVDDWFGDRGIYINQSQDGTERVVSMEFIDPTEDEDVQIDCAVAMQGGVSGGGTSLGRWKTYKLSMRPRFKPETDAGTLTGGPGKLDFKLFADSPVERHNTVVLDGVLNHSWLHPSSGQRDTALYIQDQYVADLHNAMGGHSGHGFYAHVYINTLYWGMYYIHERPDHAWAAETFGGDEDEYDAVKHNSGSVINSGLGGSASSNYSAMLSAVRAVASDPESLTTYAALCEQLDVDDFITYLLANWYTGNHDWPHKNWYATHRNTPDGKWRFHSWDAEHTLEGSNDVGESPSDIHTSLSRNAEYRLRFADLIHQFFFNEGVLTPEAAAEMYQARTDQIDRAIVGESARWGDNRQSRPYTRQDWHKHTDWQTHELLSGPDKQCAWPTAKRQSLPGRGSARVSDQWAGPTRRADQQNRYPVDGTDRWPGLLTPSTAAIPAPPVRPASRERKSRSSRRRQPSRCWCRAVRSTRPGAAGPTFDDSAWLSGTGGVGYERGTGYDAYIGIDLRETLYSQNTSCYIRIPFNLTVDDLLDAGGLTLKVRYDDGFIAYLNGTEVQRVMFDDGDTPAWNSAATGNHSDTDAVSLESFSISSYIGALRLGENVLAIHGLNSSTTQLGLHDLRDADLDPGRRRGHAGRCLLDGGCLQPSARARREHTGQGPRLQQRHLERPERSDVRRRPGGREPANQRGHVPPGQ